MELLTLFNILVKTKLDQYQKQFEEKIETKHKEKFQNKFMAFPSLLKIVKEF